MNYQNWPTLLGIGYGFAVLCGVIYGIIWAFGLLELIPNSVRLAKAAAPWLDANRELPARWVPVLLNRFGARSL
jgi:hypothetical protein